MEKFCLYLDENENIVFSRVNGDNSVTAKDVIGLNDNIYKYLEYLAIQKIINIKEFNDKDYVNINYEDITLTILGVEKIIKKEPLKNIVKSIQNYIIHKELINKRKKVTRKNKYTKSIIVAGSLVIALLTGKLVSSLNKENKKTIPDKPKSVTIQSDDYINNISEDKNQAIANIYSQNFNNLYNPIYNSANSTIDEYMTNNQYNDIQEIYVNYEDRSQDDKASTTRQLYQDIIEKYSKIYGVDKNLILGIATQERGIHSQTMDVGGATGLMQIQNAVWDNQPLCAYNFETGQYENIIVNVNDLSNLEYNIKVGTMILQNTLSYMDYNLCAAVQCYNMGYGNMKIILNKYANDSGKTIDEILSSNDLGWLDYRNLINVGDQNYLEHVMSWIGSDFTIKNLKPDGETNEICVSCNATDIKSKIN